MEREHLIIIALILVALYMMNKDTKDTVKSISPMSRIRYTGGNMDGPNYGEPFVMLPERIRHGDRDYGKGHFIKNHIRHNNRNNMFSGMMGSGCEPFRMEECVGQDCYGQS